LRRSLAVVLSAGAVIGAVLTPASASAATGLAATDLAASRPAAQAGGDPDTTVTATVTSGALTMTAPTDANLGSGPPGTVLSNTLGDVTVTDDRALLAASWNAVASSTSFVTGAGTAAETIPASDATYSPGAITTTGTITATASTITLSGSAQLIVAGTAGVGDNTATWDPTEALSVPGSAVVGTYTSTLTESVS
jgi:hypothetical protein